MHLILNEDNIKFEEVNQIREKVRAILIDENDQVLIANYGDVFLLPGGYPEDSERYIDAIIRELKEETGIIYNYDELSYYGLIEHYQKDYPSRNGRISNKLVNTYYFVGDYKGFSKKDQLLTLREYIDNLSFIMVPLENIETLIYDHISDNPRSEFFDAELYVIMQNFIQSRKKNQKLQLKK